MKLADARGAYEQLSGKASEIVRQINLAGIALIWVFRPLSATTPLDRQLLKAALFIFLALLLDFLQYLTGATTWFLYYRYKEKKRTKETDEFLAPSRLNRPMWALFYLKCAMALAAYGCYIIPFLWSRFGV